MRRRFEDAVIIGFMPRGGRPLRINPPEEEVLPDDARIIGLANNGACTHLCCARMPALMSAVTRRNLLAGHLIFAWFHSSGRQRTSRFL